MYQYPYGDSQQLNLDWIIVKLKELEASGGADLEEVSNALISLTYNTSTAYRRYDYAFLNGKLYRCLTDTSGVFNPTAWQEALIGDDLAVLTRWINAIDAAAVVDVKFDTTGTNGKIQQKYHDQYHDVVEVDYTPVQNSKRPLSSNAGYELNGAISDLPLADGKKYKICCGILRNSGNGWYVINDSGHTPLNVSSVSVNSNGDIEVAYSFTSNRIKTFICAPDETFAQKYRFGASVGNTSAKISIIKLPEIIGGMTQYDATNQKWTDTYLNGMHYESAGSGIVQMRLNDGRSIAPFPYINGEVYALSVECRYSIGMIHSIGNSGIQFKCFDPTTGQLIPTYQWQDTERAFISWNLPEKKLNANDVSDSLGNIWFFGLFEVA